MKLIVFALAFAAVLFGQDHNQINTNIRTLSRTEAKTAWATVNFSAPADLPPVTDGGLLVEAQANDSGVRVVAVFRQPGQYMLEGLRCNGRKTEIDEWQIDSSPELYTSFQVFYDSQVAERGIRTFGCFTSMSLLRIYSGTIQRSEVNLDRWNDTAPKPQVKGESVNGNSYVITVDLMPADAVVILGRNIIGEVRGNISGSSQVWFKQAGLLSRGPMTVTLCSKGRCSTSTYESRIPAGAVNPGKG